MKLPELLSERRDLYLELVRQCESDRLPDEIMRLRNQFWVTNTPLVTVATFLKGWTVYRYESRIQCVFHTDRQGHWPTGIRTRL